MIARIFRLLAVASFAIFVPKLQAQLTSGSITGSVSDSASKTAIAGARVTVVHEPTGARAEVPTAEDGRFFVGNLKPGGPYTVSVRVIGYAAKSRPGLQVTLGNRTVVSLMLNQAAVQLAGVVTTGAQQTTEKSGPTTAVSSTQIAELPTLSRSLQDITRLTPTGNGISFGGSNYRY